ncbi:tRNA1(Val) (adenine(37)-N6)-methyltransferase [Caloramator mitchellensis]|nr:tRNA1(Val) (adenine(37)-N6)-methyltransferase [Caloramator mitchellensis]
MLKTGERVDDLQLENLRIIQNPDWFCFGIDAVLLSSFAFARKKEKVVDLGTGTGIIPLLMYGKYKPSKIIGVEIQSQVAEMARRSIELNKLEEKIEIYEGDIKDCFRTIGINSFDVVVSNPPYKKSDTGLKNPEDKKAISRHEILINLDELIFSASRLLKGYGRFYMIHRPERLKDIIVGLSNHKFALKRIRFVHPKIDKEPNMVLIEAVKAGGEFLKVEKPLFVYDENGNYTEEVLKMYNMGDR